MLTNSYFIYGSIAKLLHWITAFLILIMLVLGFLMAGQQVVNIHQLVGLFLLVLVAFRLIWKLFNKRPHLPDTVSSLERFAAHIVQGLLYLCMFGMPLSGWAMSTNFGLIPHLDNFFLYMPGIAVDENLGYFFQSIHNTLALILIGLIILHFIGAMKHQLINKDRTILLSILPNRVKKP